MIFRWALWGNKESHYEMLSYSIASFKKWFGNEHQYIIFTDDKDNVASNINSLAEVEQFPNDNQTLFNLQSKATWLKWCPTSRLNKSETEIYVDADVFLLKPPTEIFSFLENDKYKFAILDEFKGESWQHGSMKRKALPNTPFVNAGFFIQKASFDITPDLLKEFDWWQQNIEVEEQTHHDEQGSLAIALTKYFLNNELYIFPKEKYMLISEDQNSEKNNLDDVTLLHSTYPHHPAFYKFLPSIAKILND